MNNNIRLAFPLAAIAAALLSVYGPALAEDGDAMKSFTKPESSIRLGAVQMAGDGPDFGKYTGVRDEGFQAVIDLDLVKRNDETGTWVKAAARNFGPDNRDLRISHERQGDWGYYFDYNQTPRYEPLSIRTGMTGVGTTAQSHPTPGAAPTTLKNDAQLKTEREGYGLGFSKQLGGGFDVQLSARSEDKDGTRMASLYHSNLIAFFTEPINSTTRQYEGTIGYKGKKLYLSGGYYGSSYTNQNAKYDARSANTAAVPVFSVIPVALPQDNESHQLFLSGGYAFTPTTKGTFKVSSTRATQNDDFFTRANTITPANATIVGTGRTSLGGRVDTTLVQMGLTSRPMPKLSLLANVRYEDRDDKTPRVQYLQSTTGRDGFNVPMSREQLTCKAEASYQLPMAMRLTGGIDVENTKRSVTPTLRQISWREKNDETSYRLELRRSLSDTLNGAVSYVQSKRGGSDFMAANNSGSADVIDPIHWADRDRKKVRLSMDWAPIESLSLQFMLDAANDRYDSAGRLLGPDTGKGRLYSIDAAYNLSDSWQATAWVSRDENHMNQSTITSANGTLVPAIVPVTVPVTPIIWQAQLSNVGDAVGFGVRGKPSARLKVGADLQFVEDTNKYGLPRLSASVGSLPAIHNRTTSLKLFGTYAVEKNSSIRLDYVYDRRTTDDWTWNNWTYGVADTTVIQDKNQNVQFIGVSYIHKF
jgi:MtrB/PioB family decaheme-associated outer membrane protein